MPKRPPPAAAPRNRFLARLPEAEFRRLLPLLQPVKLALDQVLYEPRGAIDYAYFPGGAVLSALTVMRDGNAIEVATVGNEGLVGHYASAARPRPTGSSSRSATGATASPRGPCRRRRRRMARSRTCW